MAFITASDLRTRAEAVPTTADLDTKYAATKSILESQAQEGYYVADVEIGSQNLAEFTTWINSYGFRVIAPPDTVEEARPAREITLGTRLLRRISWQTFEVQATPLQATEGAPITYSIYTKGVDNGTVLYWRTAGTANAGDFQDATLEGTATVNNNSATAVRNVRTDLATETLETVIFNLYWDSLRTDLVATNSQVTITANAT
jgi:hypothetical protein